MQNTFEFLRFLSDKGLSVSLEDGYLKVEPKSLLTDDFRTEIKKHKMELIDALLGNEPNNALLGIETPPPSCWNCMHYDGGGAAWPGICQYFELFGQEAKEIDFNFVNPNKGCRFFAKVAQDGIKAQRLKDQSLTQTATTAENVRHKAVKLPSPIALAWLAENKKALRGHGWTMSELYRRNKSKRGIVWMGLWNKRVLSVDISPDGFIVFSFPGTDRRTIRQTARPVSYLGARKE